MVEEGVTEGEAADLHPGRVPFRHHLDGALDEGDFRSSARLAAPAASPST